MHAALNTLSHVSLSLARAVFSSVESLGKLKAAAPTAFYISLLRVHYQITPLSRVTAKCAPARHYTRTFIFSCKYISLSFAHISYPARPHCDNACYRFSILMNFNEFVQTS
jgi:hypothetical protein